ncbi:MAG: murein hydrolase activator EnvC family protein [Patescibacteria group bacterium]
MNISFIQLKLTKRHFLYFLFTFLIFSFLFLILISNVRADEISDLQEQIKKYQEEIQKLEEQKKIYREKIEAEKKKAVSLKNQISILDNQIFKTKIEIKEKETKIKETELSIKNIQIKIQDQYQQIKNRKNQLANLLQTLNRYDNKSHLEIILLSSSVSNFFNQIKSIENLQTSLKENLDKIKLVKDGLEAQEKNLRLDKEKLVVLQKELTDKKNQLSLEKAAKKQVLTETRGAEWKFQSLLAAAISEQKQAEREITNAEKLIRQRLAEQKEKEMLERLEEEAGAMIFSWPVPQDTITCGFHDPDYPFIKWLGEHSGIDIRAEQGTNVRAAAVGYVAKAKDAGFGYSYIMLIHRDGFATVYGHLSKILVEEGTYVRRGQVIGKSGGLPGTPGAGRFSTGPHLHFEVRLNGIPINPIDYLI